MGVEVKPAVYIAGRRIACHADAVDREPVVVRGFSIKWGRDEYQRPSTSPASVTVSLLDTTDEWATRIRESRSVGLIVHIEWTGTTGEGTTLGPVRMFAGRIADATATVHHHHAADGRRAWLIELQCADHTADYGQAYPGPVTWPVEKMITRANRIRDLGTSAGATIREVYFWPGYVEGRCAALDVKDKSGLDLLGAMYASMGNDSYAYDPDDNVVRQSIRLSQKMSTYLATFDDSLGAVLPIASDIVVDGKTYPGIGLGGCELAGTPAIHASKATDINRLECTWKDYSTDYHDWTTIKENIAVGDSRRVMAWNSWFDAGEVIDPTLDNVWARAREEGRRPRHPEITFKPGHVFVSERVARWSLQCWENTRAAFISGDLAYQWLMGDDPAYAPVVAPIGGETSYDPARGWAVRLHVHWIHNQSPAAGAAATWSSLQQKRTTLTQPSYPWWYRLVGIKPPPPVSVGQATPERDLRWGDAESAGGYHWDSSVTWGDTRHVPTTGTQIKDVIE